MTVIACTFTTLGAAIPSRGPCTRTKISSQLRMHPDCSQEFFLCSPTRRGIDLFDQNHRAYRRRFIRGKMLLFSLVRAEDSSPHSRSRTERAKPLGQSILGHFPFVDS
jgi:hypothetical protein